MKKIILCCGILYASFCNAQIPKGVKFISGQIGYSSVTDNAANTQTESFKILPAFGYYFAPNWAIVGSLGYKNDTSESGNSKDISSAFVVTPSLRKFWVLDEKFSLFGQLDFPLEFGKMKTENTNSKTENDNFSYGISLKPGIDYAMNKHWKIAATVGEIGYSSSKKEHIDGAKNNFNFGLNFTSVNFALKYILPRK